MIIRRPTSDGPVMFRRMQSAFRGTSGNRFILSFFDLRRLLSLSGEGIIPLVEAIRQHSEYLSSAPSLVGDSERMEREVIYTAKRYFEDIALQKTTSSRRFGRLLDQVKNRNLDPYDAARKLLRKSLAVT